MSIFIIEFTFVLSNQHTIHRSASTLVPLLMLNRYIPYNQMAKSNKMCHILRYHNEIFNNITDYVFRLLLSMILVALYR